jgi:hypothetical protein
MKKNDRNLTENFQSTYFMCIPDFQGVSEDSALDAEPGDYFGEYTTSFELCVPINEGKKYTEFYMLRLQYSFQIQYDDNKKYDIVFKDINRPSFHLLHSYSDTMLDAVGTSDVYLLEFNKTTFADFAIEATKELDKYFKGMNEQFFFDFQVRKSKVILNQKLLSELQKNFYTDLVDFLEKLEKNDFKSIVEKHEITPKYIEGLANAVKLAEREYYYNKLQNDLPENTEHKSTKMPKAKI